MGLLAAYSACENSARLQISKLDFKKDTIVEAMTRRCNALSDADRSETEARIVAELQNLGWDDLKEDWEDENCGGAKG